MRTQERFIAGIPPSTHAYDTPEVACYFHTGAPERESICLIIRL